MSLSNLAGLVLALALLAALHLRVQRLPAALLALTRKERAQDGGKLLDAMTEAVASRAGHAVIAVQTYQEQMAQSLRAQIAEAETRARVAERRAADTATALQAAAALVRELRGTLETATDVMRELRAVDVGRDPRTHATGVEVRRAEAVTGPPPEDEREADDGERKTTKMPESVVPQAPTKVGSPPPPPAPRGRRDPLSLPRVSSDDDSFDGEDERTRVADRPASIAVFRLTRRAPTVLPPAPEGTAPVTSPKTVCVPRPRSSGGEGP